MKFMTEFKNYLSPIRKDDMSLNFETEKTFMNGVSPNDFMFKKKAVYAIVCDDVVLKIGRTDKTISSRFRLYNERRNIERNITESYVMKGISDFSTPFSKLRIYVKYVEGSVNIDGIEYPKTTAMVESLYIEKYKRTHGGNLPLLNKCSY